MDRCVEIDILFPVRSSRSTVPIVSIACRSPDTSTVPEVATYMPARIEKQRRLSGAVRAYYANPLAFSDFKRDAVKRTHFAHLDFRLAGTKRGRAVKPDRHRARRGRITWSVP